MNQLQPSETLPALPSAWIERLFTRLSTMYGNKFLDMWKGLDLNAVKQAWAEDLAGYTADEIKRGLDWCKAQTWPPTLPELMIACRPPLDARLAWVEACQQMQVRLAGNGGDVWSRPQIYWAAVAVGAHDLRSLAWEQVRTRWEYALGRASGEPVPAFALALPAPGSESVSREDARAKSAALAQSVAGMQARSADKVWALKLMRSEAAGEAISYLAAQTWRQALGFAADVSAAEAVAACEAQAAA